MSEQTLPTTARAWHLDSRPQGQPTASSFSLREVSLPVPGPGQLLLANEYLSVDPYMRGRMSDKKSYIEPYDVDAPMDGAAVGRMPDFVRDVGGWLAQGKLNYRETVRSAWRTPWMPSSP
jgi:NADPH-dependent curcumin reductase CurA